LIETEAGKKNQSPTKQIEYAEYETAPPAVNDAEQNHHYQNNVDEIKSHKRQKGITRLCLAGSYFLAPGTIVNYARPFLGSGGLAVDSLLSVPIFRSFFQISFLSQLFDGFSAM